MSVSRTKSVGFGLTGVFAFFVLSNLFNVLVLKANSRGAVSRKARPRLNPSPSSHLQHLEKGLRGSEQPALTPSALLPPRRISTRSPTDLEIFFQDWTHKMPRDVSTCTSPLTCPFTGL